MTMDTDIRSTPGRILEGMDVATLWPLLGLALLLGMSMTSLAAERASRGSARVRHEFRRVDEADDAATGPCAAPDEHAWAADIDRLNLLRAENDQLRARIDMLQEMLDRQAGHPQPPGDDSGMALSPQVARMVLGLDPDIPHDPRGLRRAFVTTALRVHPDRGGSPHALRLAVSCHEFLKGLPQDTRCR